MTKALKELLLKYGVASIAIIIITIQLFLVNTSNLNRWKGGGFGMYSEIHYYYNQIHIPGMSVDSLAKEDNLKASLGFLMLMPNDYNLKESAELVLKSTNHDSIHIQVWKPSINSENGIYKLVLQNEIYLKTVE